MTVKSTHPEPVSSVLKVFTILQALGENKQCGVNELSQRLMMSKSKTIHFLETMMSLGYVTKVGDDYGLTLRLFELGTKPLEYIDLETIANKEMCYISDKTGEAIHLGIMEEDSFVHTHKIDSQYNLRTHSALGHPRPLYSTAIGKMLLSGLSNRLVTQILKDVVFVKYTNQTLGSMDELLSVLEMIRERHYAEGNEEQEPGIRCIAAPIYDRLGHIVASLSISTPTIRYDENRQCYHVDLLHHCCRRISEQLGFYQYPVHVVLDE